ncbi:MAG TPA: hypothetical protein VF407_21430, partial [Polyangiaceae bacterium]
FLVLSLFASMLTIVMGVSARKKIDLAKENVTSAWEAVAELVLRAQRNPITALDLAQTMKTDEGDAERILTLLSVDDRVRAEVTQEAQIRYAPTQLRVDVDKAIPESAELAAAQSEEQRATAQTVMAPVPSELKK